MLSVAGMEACTEANETRRKGSRLLCLDGGGIRGLILIQSLLELENVTGIPIKNSFDWIAGTSTGGILALGIASGKTMRECLSLYFRMKDLTFSGSQPYPSEALEKILKDTFGPDTVMADIKQPKLLITGCLQDGKPLTFRNYETPRNIFNTKEESPFETPLHLGKQLIWHFCRDTAAPTYFSSFGRFLDGGLIENNPTLDALTEIYEYNLALRATGRESEASPLSIVVNLGTRLVTPAHGLDTSRLVMDRSSSGNLLVDQATASDSRVAHRARAWCSMTGVPYFRFSPQMSEEISVDEKSNETLCRMLWEAKVYIHSNITTLKEISDLVKAI